MILGEKELAWENRVLGSAYAHGWTVYRQYPARASQDQREPSLILVQGTRTVAVFLRLKTRKDRTPDAAGYTARTGLEAVVWTPATWTEIVAELRGAPPDESWVLRKLHGRTARRGVVLADPDRPAAETRLHPSLRREDPTAGLDDPS